MLLINCINDNLICFWKCFLFLVNMKLFLHLWLKIITNWKHFLNKMYCFNIRIQHSFIFSGLSLNLLYHVFQLSHDFITYTNFLIKNAPWKYIISALFCFFLSKLNLLYARCITISHINNSRCPILYPMCKSRYVPLGLKEIQYLWIFLTLWSVNYILYLQFCM